MGERMICAGCGVEIQTEKEGETGYTPESALKRDVVICQRCFRLKHYNEVQDISLTDDDFLRMLNQLGSQKALIVKVVDLFDFEGSWLDGMHRFTGGNPVLLVGNKVDLLPKSVKRNKVIQWMKKQAKEYGLKPVDVTLMSADTGEAVLETAELIEKYRGNGDVYVVGCTNVGKSTFINKLLREFGAEDEAMITTSNIPGTTLDMIDVPLDDGSVLYDTPGIINHNQLSHLLSKKDLKIITPKKEVKPIIFQLKPSQTLFFGAMGRIDFIEGAQQSFIVYMSNDIHIHRTKLEKADELYTNHAGKLLSPPSEEDLSSFPPFNMKEWKIPSGKIDIVFPGLGWITISGEGSVIRTHVPDGIHVTMRDSIF
jgi:30S ribosome assembly GTPase